MDASHTSRRLSLTIYRNKFDNVGRSATATWDTIIPLISKHDVRSNKDGKLFGPHKLVPGATRGNANVAYVSLATADIDNGTQLAALMPAISAFEWVAYSSHSHTDGHHKFRLVFPLTRDVPGADWGAFMTGFVSTMTQQNNDKATKDASRMFYFPSCSQANEPEKFVVHNKGQWLNPDVCFAAAMLETGAVPESMGASTPMENEFGGPREYPPYSMEKVAEKCAQVKWFKDTGCPKAEPTWHLCAGVAANAVDGVAKFHEWSKLYDEYDPADAQTKIDNWKGGPPSCSKFNDRRPEGCAGCTQSCTSPHQLGTVLVVDAPTVEGETPEGVVTQAPIPHWPSRFTRLHGGIYRQVEKDGEVENVAVCTPVFYLTERIKDEEGTYIYKARMNVRGNEWRDFEIPAKTTAELRTLKSLLASYEIVVFNDKQLEFFMNDYKISLRQYADEIQTHQRFGWTKERTGMLVGDRLATPAGSSTVRVSGMHDFMLVAGKVRGTAQEWTDGVDKLYNRDNCEPYQYGICYQFGVPLISLIDLEEWSGILFAITSTKSGIGKSTAVKIGSNALLNTSGPIMTNGTPKSVIARAAAMGTLPLIWDEVKDLEPAQFNDMAYNIFQGRKRSGLNSDGTERDVGEQFKSGVTMTSNYNAWDLLVQSQPPSIEASLMRVFEISLDDYHLPASDNEQLSLAAHLSSNVFGVWTDAYVKFVLEHQEEVAEKLQKTIANLRAWAGHKAAAERFFIYQIACTIVGGWVAKKIGAVKFDITNLFQWTKDHVKRLRRKMTDSMLRVEDQFSLFLADLHGNILVTKHFDLLSNRHGKTEMPMLQIRSAPKARLVLGSDLERGKLYVSANAIDDWCVKNKVVSSTFKRELAAAGLIRGGGGNGKGYDHKVSLGRGVPTAPTGQTRCYEFDFALAQGYKDEFVDAKVVEINTNKKVPVSVPEKQTASEEAAVTC